jgi:hypothetical protein
MTEACTHLRRLLRARRMHVACKLEAQWDERFQELARYSVYLLYWYKSTDTRRAVGRAVSRASLVLSLLALLVQKYLVQKFKY